MASEISNKIFRIFFIFLIPFWGCKKDGIKNPSEDPSISKSYLNEQYGAFTSQKADVFLPAGRNSNTPVVLLVHGGAWSDGDKSDLNDIIILLQGLWPQAAFVNLNYRLANNTPENYLPAQMEDISTLLTYIEGKKSIWQIGNTREILGVSAGAHLALLYSYAFDQSKRLKAVGSIVGPTDFSDPAYTNSPIFQLVANNFLGKTWSQDSTLHKNASPALRVTTTCPPTFMAYGALDPVVPLSNAVRLKNALQNSGVTHTYIEYPNEAHEFTNGAILDVAPKVVSFLKSHL